MKKIIVLVLALAIACLSFAGCNQYSDSKPMSNKRVDKFIEAKGDRIEDDIEDWDSFEHINLVIAVEKKFGIKFTVGEANEMKNVGEMVDIILERMPV